MYDFTSRRPAGNIVVTDPDLPTLEADTLQCVHCGAHWQVRHNSGVARGFCMNCMGPTCGKQKCECGCNPIEKQLDIQERLNRE